jgi:DNA mismatch endonuclease (patch repair protein)
MADVHSKVIRSYNMSRIKGKNTKPEMIVRKFLHRSGLRFRIHSTKFPSKADIVLPKFRTVIFVQGCFWHGHSACRYFVIPKTNTDWWIEKINATKARDIQAEDSIRNMGWNVIYIWECELRQTEREQTLENLLHEIRH